MSCTVNVVGAVCLGFGSELACTDSSSCILAISVASGWSVKVYQPLQDAEYLVLDNPFFLLDT